MPFNCAGTVYTSLWLELLLDIAYLQTAQSHSDLNVSNTTEETLFSCACFSSLSYHFLNSKTIHVFSLLLTQFSTPLFYLNKDLIVPIKAVYHNVST